MIRVRSLLFTPGNVPSMLRRLETTVEADAFVPDLEDSVPPSQKGAARDTVHPWLERLGQMRLKSELRSLLVPRVNALRSGYFKEDLRSVVVPGVDAVTIGKVHSAQDVIEIAHEMSVVEEQVGIEPGSVQLIPWIETALGVVNAYQICSSHSRVTGVAFGGEDFKTDMEIGHTNLDSELLFPRRVIALCAKAAKIASLDTPWIAFKDEEGHRKDCTAVSQMGFTGRFCIHPSTVSVVNDAFMPSAEAIKRAERIVQAYEDAERREGRGSVDVDGESVDRPVYERAIALITKAKLTVS